MKHDQKLSVSLHENAGSYEDQGDSADLERMAKLLEASGEYRVARRLEPIANYVGGPDPSLRCALILDTETTGTVVPGLTLDGQAPSEVVSLAMIAVAYEPETGEILGALDRFARYRQPAMPIPPKAIRIHGIDDAMVAGHRVEAVEIRDWIGASVARIAGPEEASRPPIIVAHNAKFDRPMVEAHWPEIFVPVPWACSLVEVPWAEHGYEGARLAYLGNKAGIFHHHHDALADAEMLACLLQQDLGGRSAMSHLLASARRPLHRIYAIAAPYEHRLVLKDREYRWNAGEDGSPRAWYRDCSESMIVEEVEFLGSGILPPGTIASTLVLDAWQRYSTRLDSRR